MIVLRRLTPDDWRVWRELRLAALAEAPYAFASKLADSQGAGDDEQRWRERLRDVPLNLVAELAGRPAGMVSGWPKDERVELISMWVAPHARGNGLADELVGAVVHWAEEQGAVEVGLRVADGNSRAAAVYRRHGFVARGTVPATDGGLPEREMVLTLPRSGGGSRSAGGGGSAAKSRVTGTDDGL